MDEYISEIIISKCPNDLYLMYHQLIIKSKIENIPQIMANESELISKKDAIEKNKLYTNKIEDKQIPLSSHL